MLDDTTPLAIPEPVIRGAEKLTETFGYWPSFHDAEVVSVLLDRGHADEGPTLTADVYLFEITSEVDPAGFYVLRHHTRATLQFIDIDELRLEDFNAQNAILGLTIADISDRQLERLRYEVRFTAAHGLDATFLCRDAAVVAVRPWNPS